LFQYKVGGAWELREVSLIHQKVLVIAEVAWEPRVLRGVYLVTWEVDGGGLKGNLFTDSTCVTLSLWPDTIYHIQVGHKTDSVLSVSGLFSHTVPTTDVECFFQQNLVTTEVMGI
jgi:hypothetical protein